MGVKVFRFVKGMEVIAGFLVSLSLKLAVSMPSKVGPVVLAVPPPLPVVSAWVKPLGEE